MSRHTEKYEVMARVYFVDIKTKEVKIQSVTAILDAYNKGNAKKKAEKHLGKLKDVEKVVIERARKHKITP